ncbi:sugar ABC transporter permease (plasmid) [Sinorhizobium meliloti]|jgi:multiple sugar transport system permease protein|uniref:carbohydrate ABC transporter permease n=1 Tax=Rhizobium meliloti TaxID=382 RepID=UPI00030AC8A0|nr:sugar ABC transporter permease [Sinorhizobium meliloti]ASQ08454.1 sugar ABC transporter permease [Sinorhizobium meliloti]MCO6420413.1 sugar ABC transporter permease [Sinorhizobium meliloti]MDE3760030.1 sugar ABC transporter permease [Sinorhizobium meliloti]MDE3877144.1 sugar ABC transporter permease [Sinorhizobium meliloti]MDW9355288.1 ABC transporter permease subunit [Sinorhizobium meliloti]
MTTIAQSAARRRHAGRTRLSAKHREWIAGYLFVLPDALGLFIFLGVPMALSLVLSVFEVNGFGGYSFVGARNYLRMWNDPLFWKGARVTALYAAMLVPLLYVCGLGLALLVQRTDRFNAVMRSMFFAPHMVSLVVVALVWQFMVVDKIGVVSRLTAALDIGGISLLGDPNFALITIVLVSVWFLMGFYMLIFLGGLQDIPRQYYEAAMIDGAGAIARFWFITLPLLKPTSFFVIMVSMVAAVAGAQAFDIIYVMTKGGPANATSVLIVYIYQQAFGFGAFGYAAAMASILVVALMIVTAVFFALTRGGRFHHEQ